MQNLLFWLLIDKFSSSGLQKIDVLTRTREDPAEIFTKNHQTFQSPKTVNGCEIRTLLCCRKQRPLVY